MTKQVISFSPQNDCILVQRDEAEDMTPGGILLPDRAKEKPSRGTVVAVGEGPRLQNGEHSGMGINDGDTILFAAWAGHEVQINGGTYLVVREKDVFGVLEEDVFGVLEEA